MCLTWRSGTHLCCPLTQPHCMHVEISLHSLTPGSGESSLKQFVNTSLRESSSCLTDLRRCSWVAGTFVSPLPASFSEWITSPASEPEEILSPLLHMLCKFAGNENESDGLLPGYPLDCIRDCLHGDELNFGWLREAGNLSNVFNRQHQTGTPAHMLQIIDVLVLSLDLWTAWLLMIMSVLCLHV